MQYLIHSVNLIAVNLFTTALVLGAFFQHSSSFCLLVISFFPSVHVLHRVLYVIFFPQGHKNEGFCYVPCRSGFPHNSRPGRCGPVGISLPHSFYVLQHQNIVLLLIL